MAQENYTVSITVNKTPEEIFNSINSVDKWWLKEFEGSSSKVDDEFIWRADRHYSKQRVVEFVPNKKVTWLVIDSKLDWLKNDQSEWTGTKMIFELTPDGKNTTLKFTHKGLIQNKECYEHCTVFWQMIIKDWLFNFIMNTSTKL